VTEWPGAEEVDSVLVVKLGLLGDLLLADPALAALRARYPKARLRLLADSPAQTAWLRREAVDEQHAVAIGVHRPTYRRLYDPRLWRDVLALRRQPPASIAVFLNDTLSGYQRRLFAAIAWASRAPRRVGVRTAETGYLTDGPAREELAGRHEIERGWLIAGGTGPAPAPRLPDADPGVAALVDAARARAPSRVVVALQPVTNKPAKQWPPSRWVELAGAVVDRLGGAVVLVGSASEGAALPAFASLGDRCVGTFGAPIAGLVAAVRGSDAYVGHDSGPFHVAAAAGTPALALVGPSDPKYSFYPWPSVRTLRRCVRAAADEECPLYLSCRDERCLPSLGTDEVFAALRALMGGAGRAP
jgi:ADP-heptose:LPS heptosyltransferase